MRGRNPVLVWHLHFRIVSGIIIPLPLLRSSGSLSDRSPRRRALGAPRHALRAHGTSISTLESRMSNSIKAKRHAVYLSQSCKCSYCTAPIWERDPDQFASTHGITRKQARLLRCTAEHLEPKSEGGSNAAGNIVAACLHCNRTRHRARVPLAPAAFRQRVRARVARGGWLPNGLARLVR